MKYVKRIISNRTPLSVRSRYSIGGEGISGQVIVHDMESGEDYVCDIRSLIHTATLGVAVNELDLCGAVVKHTDKTAKLHNYVVSTAVQYGNCDDSPTDVTEDTLLLRRGTFHGFVGASNTDVAVNLDNEAIKLAGTLGSVALWSTKLNDNNPKVYTLYDLLGKICRISNQNILKYKKIRFFGSSGIISTVRLADSKEANRFFAKMYIDVCRVGGETR